MKLKTGKLQLDNLKPYIKSDEGNQELFRKLAIPKATKLKIELLEISGIDNPSDILLEFIVSDFENKRRTIPLFKYRGKFLFQNNIFILDTSVFIEFDIPLDDPMFSLKIKSEKNFIMTLYYSTDQKLPQHETDTL